MTETERHLKEFEEHWVKIAKAIERTELSDNDAEDRKLEFEIKKSVFLLTNTILPFESYDVYNRLNNLEDWIDIAILKGRKNYRDNEGIRLKNKYGLVGEFYYWLKEIVSK